MVLAANICLLWLTIGWFLLVKLNISKDHALFIFLSSSIIIMLVLNGTAYPMYYKHMPYRIYEFLALLINRNGIMPLLTVLFINDLDKKNTIGRSLIDFLFLGLFMIYSIIEERYILVSLLSWPILMGGYLLYILLIRLLSLGFKKAAGNSERKTAKE